MSLPRFEARWRDALIAAILPPAAELDLTSFWPRFEASAPVHLRLGLRAATVAVGGALPFLLGYARPLAELDDDQREAVITAGYRMPGFSQMLDLAKVVACFAYFADPAVQAAARRHT